MALYEEKELYKTLKELGVVDSKKLIDSYKEEGDSNVAFADIILHKNLISDENLGKVVADLISVPYISLVDTPIEEKVLHLIPEVVAKKQQIIAFKSDASGIHVAMQDPQNIQTKEFVSKKVGMPIQVYYATKRDISESLVLYSKDFKKAFDKVITENVKQARGRLKADPPIIKIVDIIVAYANGNKVSDIHIEPYEEYSLVRFRMDGILQDIIKLPADLHPQIITRIKVLSKMRTDEHQAAQDGKLQYKTEEENLDIRVSITPITTGEKIVMRLLSERSRQFDLFGLGLSDKNLERVQLARRKPHGMILATGPTGCGKTMTMYTILKVLNKREINVMTIEDPVEYDIEGINQIQVNPRTELTFSKGLRSIVRQDPDIILVGEIRDEETAGIAINSAMTGHLVLSTLHTNDAATAIPRFMDMGIEPFLIASSVNVVIAQRLVRKICQNCRVSHEIKRAEISKEISPALLKKYFSTKGKILAFRGKGCEVCHNTGYRGRNGIFEVLEVDDDIRKAVVTRKNSSDIVKIAQKNGMIPMIEDGLEKVKNGLTTIEEVLRVTKE